MSAPDTRRIMIVANQTAVGSHLQRIVRERLHAGPCSFLLLVPATPPNRRLTWTDSEAITQATERMNEALGLLRSASAEIEGRVHEGSPADAVGAVLGIESYQHHQPFDEIIVSTLPPGLSRWLHQDLPNRLQKRYGIPITHVQGDRSGIRAG